MQKGYALTGIEAADAEGSPVDLQNVQKNDDGTVSFTMPAEAVSIAPVYTDNAQPLDISGEGVTVKDGRRRRLCGRAVLRDRSGMGKRVPVLL